MPIDIQARLQSIATKSGKPIAEVQNTFNTTLASLPPNISGEQTRAKYALKIVNRDLTGGSKSNAAAFEGVIVGADDPRDIMEGVRKSAIAEYQKNPELALSSGSVKMGDDGQLQVLDNRQTFPDGKPNPNFGKPRPDKFFVRNLRIAVRKPGEQEWKAGKLNLRGDQAQIPIVFGKLVSFRALGDLDVTSGEFDLRSASVTSFEVKQELPSEEVMRIIDTAFAKYYKELGKCQAYHESLGEGPAFYNRLVVTEGTVSYIKYANDPTKSHMIILKDDSLVGDQDAVQVWVPNKLKSQINFGVGSIISIIGRTRTGPGWDREKQQQDTTVTRLSLEAQSIFGRPGLVNIVEDSSSAEII